MNNTDIIINNNPVCNGYITNKEQIDKLFATVQEIFKIKEEPTCDQANKIEQAILDITDLLEDHPDDERLNQFKELINKMRDCEAVKKLREGYSKLRFISGGGGGGWPMKTPLDNALMRFELGINSKNALLSETETMEKNNEVLLKGINEWIAFMQAHQHKRNDPTKAMRLINLVNKVDQWIKTVHDKWNKVETIRVDFDIDDNQPEGKVISGVSFKLRKKFSSLITNWDQCLFNIEYATLFLRLIADKQKPQQPIEKGLVKKISPEEIKVVQPLIGLVITQPVNKLKANLTDSDLWRFILKIAEMVSPIRDLHGLTTLKSVVLADKEIEATMKDKNLDILPKKCFDFLNFVCKNKEDWFKEQHDLEKQKKSKESSKITIETSNGEEKPRPRKFSLALTSTNTLKVEDQPVISSPRIYNDENTSISGSISNAGSITGIGKSNNKWLLLFNAILEALTGKTFTDAVVEPNKTIGETIKIILDDFCSRDARPTNKDIHEAVKKLTLSQKAHLFFALDSTYYALKDNCSGADLTDPSAFLAWLIVEHILIVYRNECKKGDSLDLSQSMKFGNDFQTIKNDWDALVALGKFIKNPSLSPELAKLADTLMQLDTARKQLEGVLSKIKEPVQKIEESISKLQYDFLAPEVFNAGQKIKINLYNTYQLRTDQYNKMLESINQISGEILTGDTLDALCQQGELSVI